MTSCSCCREACRSAHALVNSSCQESQSAGYTISLNWRDGEHNGRIGFDPEIGLSWLDLTAGSVSDGLDAPHDRQELTHRLAGEIPAQEARRKTVTVLARIWARAPLRLSDHVTAMRHSDRFEITRQGLDLEIVSYRLPCSFCAVS